MMYRHDAPPEPPSSSTQFGAMRLPFDLADVAVGIAMLATVLFVAFVTGLLIGTFAAGVVVAFRALT